MPGSRLDEAAKENDAGHSVRQVLENACDIFCGNSLCASASFSQKADRAKTFVL